MGFGSEFGANTAWDSAEGKLAATLSKEAGDKDIRGLISDGEMKKTIKQAGGLGTPATRAR